MTTIGSFVRNHDGSLSGEIITLSVQAKNVLITAEAGTAAPGGPTHRITVGSAHIGAGWLANADTEAFLRIVLDDPSFTAPIVADLVAQPDKSYAVVWKRRNE